MEHERPLRICVSGALGGVGRHLVEAIIADPTLVLAGAVARREVGRDVGEVLGLAPCGVVVTDDLPPREPADQGA